MVQHTGLQASYSRVRVSFPLLLVSLLLSLVADGNPTIQFELLLFACMEGQHAFESLMSGGFKPASNARSAPAEEVHQYRSVAHSTRLPNMIFTGTSMGGPVVLLV